MLTSNRVKQRRTDVTIFRSAAMLIIHAILRVDLTLPRHRIQKYPDLSVHTVPNCLGIQNFPLWRADSKSCGFACEFEGFVWTKGELIRKKKVADSKISGYVWTGPS